MVHLFIINPKAGREDSSASLQEKISRTFSGEEIQIRISEKAGDCAAFAREAGETGIETRIYSCGGDGTLNEVVSGAFGYPNLSVTCVPCGSGNDWIKSFGNPDAFYDLADFRACTEQKVDLIRVNDRYALNICSAGFDARIGTAIDAYRRHPILHGQRAYHASVVVNLIKGVAKQCHVEFPDGTVVDEKLTMVCICSGGWYGGSYHAFPDADFTDGWIDVLVVKKVSRLQVAAIISAYQKGKWADYPKYIRHYRTQQLKISTPESEPVNLDGELLRTSEVEIEVIPGAIRFFAPENAW